MGDFEGTGGRPRALFLLGFLFLNLLITGTTPTPSLGHPPSRLASICLKKIQQEQYFLFFPFLEPVTFNSSLSIVLSLSSSVFVPMETAGLSGKERITCFRRVFALSFDLMKRTS